VKLGRERTDKMEIKHKKVNDDLIPLLSGLDQAMRQKDGESAVLEKESLLRAHIKNTNLIREIDQTFEDLQKLEKSSEGVLEKARLSKNAACKQFFDGLAQRTAIFPELPAMFEANDKIVRSLIELQKIASRCRRAVGFKSLYLHAAEATAHRSSFNDSLLALTDKVNTKFSTLRSRELTSRKDQRESLSVLKNTPLVPFLFTSEAEQLEEIKISLKNSEPTLPKFEILGKTKGDSDDDDFEVVVNSDNPVELKQLVVSLEQDKARMNERIAALSKQLDTLDKEKRPSVDSLKAFVDAKNENALLHDQVKMLADTIAEKDKRLENMSAEASQKSRRIDELLKEKNCE